MNWGMLLALFGAGLAVTTNCFGSSKGVGMVAEAASPVIAEDSSKFGKLLVLMLLPGSQGLYGLVMFPLSESAVFSLTASLTGPFVLQSHCRK